MAFHLKPKEEKFFALLDQHAMLSYQAADLLRQAMNDQIPKEEALEKSIPWPMKPTSSYWRP